MTVIRYPRLPKGFPNSALPIGSHYVVDTEAELPASANQGDQCHTKDTGKVWTRGTSAWLAPETGTGGGPHTHPILEITGLQTALDGKADIGLGSGDTFIKLVQSSNISTGANVTPVSCPGLVFDYEANSVYSIDIYALTQAAAATTGHGFQLDVSTSVILNAVTFYHQLANTGTLTGGSSIADDASVGVSSGQPTLNTAVLNHGAGLLFTSSTPGTAQLRFRSETNAVATCLGGSIMRALKIV